jgi:peptidoglycan/xylan/chitin deacetylase (PgdA/CDA1 family)
MSRSKACVIAMATLSMILVFLSFMSNTMIVTTTSSEMPDPDIKVPIIMYHSVIDSKQNLGAYVLNLEELRRDLLYIKEKGYTPILLSDLINYHNIPYLRLPEKPIILTFDDGFYNNYSLVFPLIQEMGMKFVFSVVGEYVEKESESKEKQVDLYSYVNWSQVREMYDSGIVDILNHSYSFHKINGRRGMMQKQSENDSVYLNTIKTDLLKVQDRFKEHGIRSSNAFTYPFGLFTPKTQKILAEMGYEAVLTCTEGVNVINRSSSLMELKRYNRIHGPYSEKFFEKILE